MAEPKKSNPAGAVLLGVAALVGSIYALSGPSADPMEVNVTGPSTAELGKQVVLRAEGNATNYIWDFDKLLAPYEGCDNRDFVFSCVVPGEYAVTLVGTDTDSRLAKYRHVIRIGGTGPIPPGPGPKPPDPPVPVVTELPFQITIIHESADDTVEQARLWSNLRSGATASYLKGKGHTLNIIDDDAKDASGQPSAIVTQWAPFPNLPEVIVADKNGKLVHRFKLPAGDKPDAILDELKKRGG